MVGEATIAMSPAPPSTTHEVVDMQLGLVVSSAPPPTIVDASVIVVRSLAAPAVAWEPQAIGFGESSKTKPPNPAASVVCPKGAAVVYSCWSARLVAKYHRGTFKRSVSHRRLHYRLSNKVVLRRRMDRLCSWCPRRGVAPFGRC
jgi:hypothetical protein